MITFRWYGPTTWALLPSSLKLRINFHHMVGWPALFSEYFKLASYALTSHQVCRQNRSSYILNNECRNWNDVCTIFISHWKMSIYYAECCSIELLFLPSLMYICRCRRYIIQFWVPLLGSFSPLFFGLFHFLVSLSCHNWTAKTETSSLWTTITYKRYILAVCTVISSKEIIYKAWVMRLRTTEESCWL